MTDLSVLLQYIQDLPIVSLVSGIVALFWIIFSFSITYHWLVYGRNIVISILVLIVYYGVSLFLIGMIVSEMPYV
tara:strand:- start:12499 stop:12723 length:225 start_codon:yes stop_codon:yes gene_type:complete